MIDPSMMGGPPPGMDPGMGGPPPGMGGPPPMEPPPEEAPSGPVSDLLRQILDLADEYRGQEESDQNLLLVEQLRTIAQKILANEEKEDEGLMQGKLSPGAVRRAVGPGY